MVSVVTSPEQREEADRMRERHRLEQLLAEHHRQIPLAKGKHLVRLTLSLADVERKLGDLQEEYAEAA